MTTPIVAGLGVAAVAYSGRAAILAFEAWKKAPRACVVSTTAGSSPR